MKKIIVILLLFQWQFSSAIGLINKDVSEFDRALMMDLDEDCDACGCSANGGGMGYSSILDQNFVGVRYFYQYYKSKDGLYNDSPWIDENFNTVQIWAKIPLTRRWQISALIPYQSHNNEKISGPQRISGLGDMTLLGFYGLVLPNEDVKQFSHQWQFGGGVKLPTGTYNSNQNGSVNPSFQVGTGSWDFILTSEYTLKYRSIGLQSMVSYTFKNENRKHYQFGNQWSYTSTLFHSFQQRNFTWIPQLGIAGEVFESNREYKENVNNTSGDVLFGKLGVEMGYSKFSVGLTAMLPINQNLTGGKVEAQSRWSVNLNYSL